MVTGTSNLPLGSKLVLLSRVTGGAGVFAFETGRIFGEDEIPENVHELGSYWRREIAWDDLSASAKELAQEWLHSQRHSDIGPSID